MQANLSYSGDDTLLGCKIPVLGLKQKAVAIYTHNGIGHYNLDK